MRCDQSTRHPVSYQVQIHRPNPGRQESFRPGSKGIPCRQEPFRLSGLHAHEAGTHNPCTTPELIPGQVQGFANGLESLLGGQLASVTCDCRFIIVQDGSAAFREGDAFPAGAQEGTYYAIGKTAQFLHMGAGRGGTCDGRRRHIVKRVPDIAVCGLSFVSASKAIPKPGRDYGLAEAAHTTFREGYRWVF